MTHSLFLRIKSLNVKTMRGVSSPKSVIRVAAMHNLREIAAEFGIGADSHIDPSRIKLNYQLRGPETAAGVAELAQVLLDGAGINSLRKDAAMALEVIFSLPQGCAIDHREFFAESVAWADAFFNAPILSAAVHLDEAAPHCHVLVLPLVGGRMNGGKLAGGPSKIRLMQADFSDKVGKRYGLAQQAPRKSHSAATRQQAMDSAFAMLEANSGLNGAVLCALLKPHAKNPEPLLLALGIAMPAPVTAKGKSFAAIMTAPCKPERKTWPPTSIDVHAKSIDVAPHAAPNDPPKIHQRLSCVDVQLSAPSFSPTIEQPSATESPTTDHHQPDDQAPANAAASDSIDPSSTGTATMHQRATSPADDDQAANPAPATSKPASTGKAQPMSTGTDETIPASPAPDQRQQAPADNATSTTATPPPDDAGNDSPTTGKSFDPTPAQPDQRHQGRHHNAAQQEEPAISTAEGDYTRQRDDDQRAEYWDESRGEFARPTANTSCKPAVIASVRAALEAIGRHGGTHGAMQC